MSTSLTRSLTQEIDEVVHALETIAYQINRLALDASIQVAMARGTNTGFGKVVDEMRRLAEQTKGNLNTVSSNVRSVRTEMVTATEAIQESKKEAAEEARHIKETGASLSTIFSIFEQQAGEIGTINLIPQRKAAL